MARLVIVTSSSGYLVFNQVIKLFLAGFAALNAVFMITIANDGYLKTTVELVEQSTAWE